jgi:hypothetical protein
MSGMRSLLSWCAAVGLLVGLVVLGAEAAALHFGDQRSVVFDAPYEPRIPDEGTAYSADLFLHPELPWWKQLVLPWWGYPVIGAGVGAVTGLACGVAGLRISQPGRR